MVLIFTYDIWIGIFPHLVRILLNDGLQNQGFAVCDFQDEFYSSI